MVPAVKEYILMLPLAWIIEKRQLLLREKKALISNRMQKEEV